ncbi:CheR family methyltransferase [Massilia sp. R2A-15]|uniref:CheR family methyltransferase n=1 Tax=Massilia sp. R2A-15 TaxID=3064278 RepID=UPI002732EE61|nr:CheR family methyltransferase [Massilia sp. R2A-15]WLI90325.1 CheR family methyltransferase [Massilia sp. R2A-15]
MSARAMLQRATGLEVSQQAVDRALRERMAKCGIDDAGRYLKTISPEELAALVELVVVPESWMFRDPEAFKAATAFVQRRLAERPERIVRILSLPCAGGEEPYSMAMSLADAAVDPGSFRIDGMDLSSVALERAMAGRYTRNAFRGRDLAFRERHFTRVGDEYQIGDALRSQVSFAQGNLLEFDVSAAAGRYDVVFCRNLLIYFDEPTAAAAIAILRTLLADDGMLFAGYAEVPSFVRNGFAPLRVPGAFALQKTPAAVAPPAPAAKRVARVAAKHGVRSAGPDPVLVAKAAPQKAPAPAAPVDLLAQARSQADRGDYKDAAASCHALLAKEPNAAEAYYILGLVSEIERKPGAADGYWRRCVYLQPDHYEALCHLALLADQAGDTRQADTLRQRAARIYGRRQHDGGAAR